MYDNKIVITNTNSGQEATAEIDNFREGKSFDAFIATNKIHFNWNGRTYVGNAHGMEFTSSGPKEIKKLKGRF